MLVLASASPRRRDLLTQAGFSFSVDSADVPETPIAGEDAATYVLRLAEAKAQAVWARQQAGAAANEVIDPLIVLGADTCVLCQGEILGKPADAADARRMLELLSGRTHQVLTGLCALTRGESFARRGDHAGDLQTFLKRPSWCGISARLNRWIRPAPMASRAFAARWIPRIEGDYIQTSSGCRSPRTVALLEEARHTASHRAQDAARSLSLRPRRPIKTLRAWPPGGLCGGARCSITIDSCAAVRPFPYGSHAVERRKTPARP